MSRYERTPSKVMVTALDMSDVEAQALAWLRDRAAVDQEHGKDTSMPTGVRVGFGPWGIVETPRGVFALNNEGVGNNDPISREHPLVVELYIEGVETDGTGKQTISMFPACSYTFGDVSAVRALTTGDPVRLIDFVRSFGARLDGNYESWRRRLEAAQAVTA